MEKAKLLHETAEIALTEIKRYFEPRLMEALSLRRVTAPLYLPVGSPLLDKRHPGAQIYLPGSRREVEIVGSLNVWLRGQLRRYDIAPGFGVFTIMNALRPEMPDNSTSSPHIAAWAWQQAVDRQELTEKHIVETAKKVHQLVSATEKMVLTLFHHMSATIDKELRVVNEKQLAELYPDLNEERRLYEHMHPDNRDNDTDVPPVLLLIRECDDLKALGELWTWNLLLRRPVMIADIAAWDADHVAGPSVGGNIYRGMLALQILQQDKLI